jgi:sugar O-acyltransferase (sialic acid O-acetyltransferase NeuD family)
MTQRQQARIAIYGCGGFGREVLPLVRMQCVNVVFVSDTSEEIGTRVNGADVISFRDLISPGHQDRHVCIAIGAGVVRRAIAEKCETANLHFASVFANTYVAYDKVEIAPGAVFCHQTFLTSNIKIGHHFQCNIFSYVAHDCVIGDFVTFAPRVSCNGNVEIEDDVYVGTGVIIKPGSKEKPLRIGKGAVIGMGAVVTKDVPANTVVVGNPARLLRGK